MNIPVVDIPTVATSTETAILLHTFVTILSGVLSDRRVTQKILVPQAWLRYRLPVSTTLTWKAEVATHQTQTSCGTALYLVVITSTGAVLIERRSPRKYLRLVLCSDYCFGRGMVTRIIILGMSVVINMSMGLKTTVCSAQATAVTRNPQQLIPDVVSSTSQVTTVL